MITETYQVGEFLVETYDNPSVNLTLSDQERLVREFTPAAKNSFNQPDFDEGVLRRHYLTTSTTIVVRGSSGNVAGFAGSSILEIDDDKVIYLQGGVISESCRDRGLYRILIGSRILANVKKIRMDDRDHRKVLIAGRTQNPLVYKFMHRKLGVFPHPDGYIHHDLINKAKKITQKIYEKFSDFHSSEGCVFDTSSFVLKRAFGSESGGEESGYSLYGNNIPFCKDDDAINQYMKNHIDWHNGDTLIMLGYYNKQDVLALFRGYELELNPAIAA